VEIRWKVQIHTVYDQAYSMQLTEVKRSIVGLNWRPRFKLSIVHINKWDQKKEKSMKITKWSIDINPIKKTSSP